MQNDVGAPIDGSAAIWTRKRVIRHERNAVIVGNGAHRFDVQDVDLRVSERFGKDALRLRRNRTPDGVVVANVHEDRVDANLTKGNVELIDGAAVERRGRDELVAGAHKRKQRDVLGRLSGCSCNCPDAVLKSGDALLKYSDRRINAP